MKAAGVALSLGLDPLRFLALPAADIVIARAILAAADKETFRREEQFATMIGNAVARVWGGKK